MGTEVTENNINVCIEWEKEALGRVNILNDRRVFEAGVEKRDKSRTRTRRRGCAPEAWEAVVEGACMKLHPSLEIIIRNVLGDAGQYSHRYMMSEGKAISSYQISKPSNLPIACGNFAKAKPEECFDAGPAQKRRGNATVYKNGPSEMLGNLEIKYFCKEKPRSYAEERVISSTMILIKL